MSREDYLFTSESVSEGHPDKICDRISDAIVDEFLKLDPYSRCAVETMATTNKVVLAGEVRGPSELDAHTMEKTARRVIKDIGYAQDGFHWDKADIDVYVHEQSADIAQGVDESEGKDEGAGDQGIMFGYAVNETPELMPAPILYAHKILRLISESRHDGSETQLGPDAKSQLTLRYENGKPVEVASIVLSTQHYDGSLSSSDVRDIVTPYIKTALPEGWLTDNTVWHVNPTGKFVIGGPDGDAGLTGRKIIVDTYGGAAPHGGGAFSGKDPTKVDRSAAYAARYLAKNVVAAGYAERCSIQLAYAIGISEPLSLYVDSQGTSTVDESVIEKALWECMSLTPRGIRTHLGLNKPIYERTAAYGHFGREPEADGGFSWEKLDLVEKIRASIG
ncbi:methionine adenosyltransferase [Cohaesibacter sp. ES.047]|uniref:methionine adenosyltransferase n=1 Tax=Cohaesibacter sp. ES.047 TaxID=1798205 RepID=UPI000BB8D0B8|nr:methionine adenosyltransferase [Cohaesibacter sp. ES.047]SNY90741.1 methionine adenosyltransferase [Cohaesibacter sp. ES.047]